MDIVYLVDTSNILWNDIKHNTKHFNDRKITGIETLRLEKDRCNSIIGRLILFYYLKKRRLIINNKRITIKYSKTGKPFIDEYKGLHFNISHSNKCVACAISTDEEIGVDIEAIKSINIHEYASVFTEEEFLFIINSKKSIFNFYTLWTLKEAFLKALGQGFNFNPQMFNVLSSPLIISGCHYYLNSTIWDTNHILSTCTLNNNNIRIMELSVYDIIE